MRSPNLVAVDDIEVWESILLKEVCRVVKEVWTVSGKPKQVYLAVDGVVPMAKIRQQRVRRFKSAWLRKNNSSSWDSNAITPGTQFMKKLGRELEKLCKSQSGWSVSGVDQEGEGEHKIMKWLRERSETGTVVIYGLDADLILLSMLTGELLNRNIVLLREKQEFGGKVASGGEQEYSFMDIQELKIRLDIKGVNETTNYVALMSLMGNDFLPHSLTHKLNDDGHDCIMRELRAMKQGRGWFITENGDVSREVLLDICKRWCVDEEDRMLHCIQKKNEQALRGVSNGMDASEGLPLEWKVERDMIVGKGMSPTWRSQYWAFIHPQADRAVLCSEYVYGLQWIIDYYTGKPVNLHWVFPSWIPPLWSDLTHWLSNTKESSTRPPIYNVPIKPEEQLAMVLPLESWNLIDNKDLKNIPLLVPQMWPSKFTFFSFGRKWLWECEARIPVLTAERLHDILKGTTIDGECAGKNS